MKRIVSAIFLATLLCSLFCGCSLLEASPKTFSASGMSITLTEDFTERDYVSFTATYDSQYVAVFALKETFDLIDATGVLSRNSTTEEYAKFVIQGNQLDCEPVSENGLLSFVYQSENNGVDYTYFATIHKSSDAFWMIQFATKTSNFEKQKDNILTYAKSISFS